MCFFFLNQCDMEFFYFVAQVLLMCANIEV